MIGHIFLGDGRGFLGTSLSAPFADNETPVLIGPRLPKHNHDVVPDGAESMDHLRCPKGTMESYRPGPWSLYRSLLGTAWSDLHPSMCHFHQGGSVIEGIGRFQICHGNTMLARLLAGLLQLPTAGATVPTRLTILPNIDGEIWLRMLGHHRLISRQQLGPGSLLAERFGRLEFRFRLQVVEEGIVYQQVAVALRIGPWLVPLPRWIAPRVVAQEMPATDRSRKIYVQVGVTVPWAGDLLGYSGHIEWEDALR